MEYFNFKSSRIAAFHAYIFNMWPQNRGQNLQETTYRLTNIFARPLLIFNQNENTPSEHFWTKG